MQKQSGYSIVTACTNLSMYALVLESFEIGLSAYIILYDLHTMECSKIMFSKLAQHCIISKDLLAVCMEVSRKLN